MIELTRLNGVRFVLNEELIETIQENPDTTIVLRNGNLYIVHETMDEVIQLCKKYKECLYQNRFNTKVKDD
jgi:flagellar protein FlbD